MKPIRIFYKIKEKLKRILNFLKEVKLEAKKISWPGVRETFKYTLIVIFVSIVVAIFLGGMDFFFTMFLNRFIL